MWRTSFLSCTLAFLGVANAIWGCTRRTFQSQDEPSMVPWPLAIQCKSSDMLLRLMMQGSGTMGLSIELSGLLEPASSPPVGPPPFPVLPLPFVEFPFPLSAARQCPEDGRPLCEVVLEGVKDAALGGNSCAVVLLPCSFDCVIDNAR